MWRRGEWWLLAGLSVVELAFLTARSSDGLPVPRAPLAAGLLAGAASTVGLLLLGSWWVGVGIIRELWGLV